MFKQLILTTLCAVAMVVARPAAACDTTTAHEETTSPVEYSSAVQLSELFPAPSSASDAEEFIELFNNGNADVNLAGWAVSDASGKKYTVSTDDFVSTVISAGGFFFIPQSTSGISLNNSGDTVSVLQPNDTVLETTTYETAEYDYSWARFASGWEWTERATEGAANELVRTTTDTTQEENDGETTNDTTSTDNDESGSAGDPSLYQTSSGVRLSELLPNPSGLDSTDEWIEIVNEGSDDVYLGGWQLTDESDYYTLGDVTLAAGEYLTFEIGETGITLNNSGDKLFLIDPFGAILQGVEYGSASDGLAWARIGESWQWTSELTPNDANVWSDADENAPDSDEDGDTNGDSENTDNDADDGVDTDVISISTFRSLEDGNTATVEGAVTVLPGVFGSQYFYIQDADGGLQVYSYSKSFPELAVGDRVRVTGEKSTSHNEARIKTSTQEDIAVVAHDEQVVARDVAELDESLEGLLVQVEGVVVDSSSTEAVINELVKVVLKSSANIDDGLLEEGSSVAVVGIVGQYDTEYRVMPRNNDDISAVESETSALIQPAEAATHTRSDGGLSLSQTNGRGSSTLLSVAVIIGLLAIIAGMTLRQHRTAALSWIQQRIAGGTTAQQAEPKKSAATIFQSLRKKQAPVHNVDSEATHSNPTLTNTIDGVKESHRGK